MPITIGGGITLGGGIYFDADPSTTDPYWANVTTLLSSTATTPPANNDTFIDSSANNFTVTRVGGTTQGSFSPFTSGRPYNASVNGGSAYFDGSGDYLTVAPATQTYLSSNPFTMEAWVYPTATNGIVAGRRSAVSARGFLFGFNSTNNFRFWAGDTDTISWNVQLTSPSTYNLNQWYHVAATRDASNVFTLWINGVSVATATASFTIADDTSTLQIGTIDSGSGLLTGYLSNFRLVTGSAVYTSNFTPPTAPLTAVAGTSLLLGMTNAGIYDSAQDSVFATVNNTALTTAVKNFGNSSIAFDGTDDYMVAPSATTLDFGTGDFTIETWVNFGALTTNRIIFDRWATGNTGGWQLYWRQTGTSLTFFVGSAIVIQDASTTRITTGTWYHVAVTRASGTMRMFVNGTEVGSASNTASLSSSLPLAVGIQYTTLTNDFNGYLSDFRITKGVARYTANFTAPTEPFPTS